MAKNKLIISFQFGKVKSFNHKSIERSTELVKSRNQRNMIEARIKIANQNDLLFDFAKQSFVVEGTKGAWTKQDFTIDNHISPVNVNEA